MLSISIIIVLIGINTSLLISDSDYSENTGLIETSSPEIWRTWGGNDVDKGNSITGDESFLYTLGYTTSFGTNNSADLSLIKWSKDGSVIWSKTWGANYSEWGESICIHENYIYTVGESGSREEDWRNSTIIKWSKDGDIIWSRILQEEYHFNSITSDGNYLYTLGSEMLTKWTTEGNIVWNKNVQDRYFGNFRSIASKENYLYVFGRSYNNETNNNDFMLIKLGKEGRGIWSKIWGSKNEEIERSSIIVDGNYLYTIGSVITLSTDSASFVITKWNTNGDVLWSKTWDAGSSSICYGNSIASTNNYLYALGTSWSTPSSPDFTLVKLSKDGHIIGSKIWGGQKDEFGESIYVDKKDIYIVGETTSVGAGSSDLALTKIAIDKPSLSRPNNITYREGASGNRIVWTAYGDYPDTYSIARNGLEIKSGEWSWGESIIVNVDGLSKGEYSYTITIKDESSNSVSDTVIVKVLKENDPDLPEGIFLKWSPKEVILYIGVPTIAIISTVIIIRTIYQKKN